MNDSRPIASPEDRIAMLIGRLMMQVETQTSLIEKLNRDVAELRRRHPDRMQPMTSAVPQDASGPVGGTAGR